MKSGRAFLGGSVVLVLTALGLGRWLWPPPFPSSPRFASLEVPEGRLWARADQAEVLAGELGVWGPEVEMWLESPQALGPVVFQLRGRLTEVEVRSGRSATTFVPPPASESVFFEWQPELPRRRSGISGVFYRLVMAFPDLGEPDAGNGPRVAYLGTRERLDREIYAVDWLGCGAPRAVARGEELLVLAHLRNASSHPWPHEGAARVRLAHRWLDAGDEPPGSEGPRADFRSTVEPGEERSLWIPVRAPSAGGLHALELDLVFEPMARFSEKGAATCRAEIAVR